MCNALRELMKEDIMEARQETRLEAIKNLMTNLKWTAEQVMEAMSIPVEEWDFYKANL